MYGDAIYKMQVCNYQLRKHIKAPQVKRPNSQEDQTFSNQK